MTEETLNLIEENYQAGKFLNVKSLYEDYFKSLEESALDFLFLCFEDRYFDVTCKSLKIDLDENNPIFIKLDKEYEVIQKKILEKEELSEYENNLRKLLTYETSYIIHWGKYENQRIDKIIEEDIRYILWCIINLEHFSIVNPFFLKENVQNHSFYEKALEINLIKHLIVEKWKGNIEENEEYKEYEEHYHDDQEYAADYGYDSWDEMTFYTAFDGDEDAWARYNE